MGKFLKVCNLLTYDIKVCEGICYPEYKTNLSDFSLYYSGDNTFTIIGGLTHPSQKERAELAFKNGIKYYLNYKLGVITISMEFDTIIHEIHLGTEGIDFDSVSDFIKSDAQLTIIQVNFDTSTGECLGIAYMTFSDEFSTTFKKFLKDAFDNNTLSDNVFFNRVAEIIKTYSPQDLIDSAESAECFTGGV